jgi:hypothetical protein
LKVAHRTEFYRDIQSMRPQDFSMIFFVEFHFLLLIFVAATPIDSKRRAETWKRNRRALVRDFIFIFYE